MVHLSPIGRCEMKRYIGSKISAFSAVIAPLLALIPLIFGIASLCGKINAANIFVGCMSFACAIIWLLYTYSIKDQLYSWGVFGGDGIQVTSAFKNRYTLIYKDCRSCGIGYYTHSFRSPKMGIRIYFIFLSCDIFDESFRSNMNLWKPTKKQIKVAFDLNLYEYLVDVLPEKQSNMLRRDYIKYMMGEDSALTE